MVAPPSSQNFLKVASRSRFCTGFQRSPTTSKTLPSVTRVSAWRPLITCSSSAPNEEVSPGLSIQDPRLVRIGRFSTSQSMPAALAMSSGLVSAATRTPRPCQGTAWAKAIVSTSCLLGCSRLTPSRGGEGGGGFCVSGSTTTRAGANSTRARARAGPTDKWILQEDALTVNRAAALGLVINGKKVDASGARGYLDSGQVVDGRMAPKKAPVERHEHRLEFGELTTTRSRRASQPLEAQRARAADGRGGCAHRHRPGRPAWRAGLGRDPGRGIPRAPRGAAPPARGQAAGDRARGDPRQVRHAARLHRGVLVRPGAHRAVRDGLGDPGDVRPPRGGAPATSRTC
jgi:hypothetical protein